MSPAGPGRSGTSVPCVLMRAGTSRGPFFLRSWLPADPRARDEALIGAIGASDLLALDGVGGGSTLTSKVAIVSPSAEPGCDVDYLFAQVGVGSRSVDTRPNCGNMLSGVAPFALEQGLVPAGDPETTVRVFNVNTRSRIDAVVQTPGGRVTYAGDTRIDGVAGTAAPVRLRFLDAWGAVTGSVFPTGTRVDVVDGVELTCIDAAMPLMVVRAADLGLVGREAPDELDARADLLERLESLRRVAGERMGLGDVTDSVVPKPVLVSPGDGGTSITSRYFTPRRAHTSHAVTGAIGVATAFALPGTVASSLAAPALAAGPLTGTREVAVLHPQGRIAVEVALAGAGDDVRVEGAALVRTARKIFEGELHLPDHVFSAGVPGGVSAPAGRTSISLIVTTAAGGANDVVARTVAQRLGPLLGETVTVDNRPGGHGLIAAEHAARAAADGRTLLLGGVATHAIHPARDATGYDPVAGFAPVGLVGFSPTVLVVPAADGPTDVPALLARLRAHPGPHRYASAGEGTAPHLAGELLARCAGVRLAPVVHTGSSPALGDLVHGRARFMFPSLFTARPWLASGRLRALAVAGPARVAALPGVPTLAEVGVDGVEVTQWYALFAPAGTPTDVVTRLNAALTQVLASADAVAPLRDQGLDLTPGPPAALGELVDSELRRWRAVLAGAHLLPSR